MEVNFNYYALKYLMNVWLGNDCECVKLITNNDKDKRLEAIKKAASFYSISRNFPTKFDLTEEEEEIAAKSNKKIKPDKRYRHVLSILEELGNDKFTSLMSYEKVCKRVLEIKSEISKKYSSNDKERNLISATTKFLWLKYKSPIVIYDSRAVRAITEMSGDLKVKDYKTFYDKWKEEYKNNQPDIKKACNRLYDIEDFLPDRECEPLRNIKDWTSKPWFHERVFDIYLWEEGSPNSNKG